MSVPITVYLKEWVLFSEVNQMCKLHWVAWKVNETEGVHVYFATDPI